MKLSTFTYDKKNVIKTSLALGIPMVLPGNKDKPKAFGQCGLGLGCSGGGGECGLGLGCSGYGDSSGYGQCGLGLGCSGGGGECGLGLGCSGW